MESYTELRFFLLYAGPIVLKGILRNELYNHFLLFHAACRILCSKKICLKYTNQAKQYLISFFIALKDYYGVKTQTFNAHNLIHLSDDVTFMGCCLSSITAFPFENLLGKMRKYLRSAVRPLAQLSRRLFEENSLKSKKSNMELVKILSTFRNGDIKCIRYNDLTISASSPDNMVLFENGDVVQVKQIIGQTENPHLVQISGVVWDKEKPIFSYPCNSEKLQMWELKKKPTKKNVTRFVKKIDNKLVKLSVLKENNVEKCYVLGMLH